MQTESPHRCTFTALKFPSWYFSHVECSLGGMCMLTSTKPLFCTGRWPAALLTRVWSSHMSLGECILPRVLSVFQHLGSHWLLLQPSQDNSNNSSNTSTTPAAASPFYKASLTCPGVDRLLSMRACLVAQSCLTLSDPIDGSPPGSSVHESLQARILEWVAIPSS